MRNLSLKYAALCARITGLLPEARLFIGKTPHEKHAIFLNQIPHEKAEILSAGFSPWAVIQILNHEFTLDIDNSILSFNKERLDKQSLYNSNLQMPRTPAAREDAMLAHLARQLMACTRDMYRFDAPFSYIDAQCSLYQEMLRGHIEKVYQQHVEKNAGIALSQRQNIKTSAMDPAYLPVNQLSQLMRDTGLFQEISKAFIDDTKVKVEASAVLFGSASDYCTAWRNQVKFQQMLATAVGKTLKRQMPA